MVVCPEGITASEHGLIGFILSGGPPAAATSVFAGLQLSLTQLSRPHVAFAIR